MYNSDSTQKNAFEYNNLGMGTYKDGRDGNYTRYETNQFVMYTGADGHAIEAWSYDWWQFIRMSADNSTLYFNDHGYSMQTRGHQSIAERILAIADLESHGISLVKVYYREGLQNMQGALEGLYKRYLEEFHNAAVRGKEYNDTYLTKKIDNTIEVMKDMGLNPVTKTVGQLEEMLEEIHVKYLDDNLSRWSSLNHDRMITDECLAKFQGRTVKIYSNEVVVLGKGKKPGTILGRRESYHGNFIEEMFNARVDFEVVATDAEFFKGLADLD